MYGCVYIMTNVENGHQYVGQTRQPIEKRMAEHRQRAGRSSMPISRAIAKYGWDSFEYKVIAECSNQKELDEVERNEIKRRECTVPDGYNVALGGQSGCRFGENVRGAISASVKELWEDPEYRARQMRSPSRQKGWHHSDEARRKISQAQIGRKASRETVRKRQLSRSKKIMNVTTGEVFHCVADAADAYGRSRKSIRDAMSRNGKCAGCEWRYVDEPS